MKPIQMGNIQVQRVEELIWEISPRFLFPQLDLRRLREAPRVAGSSFQHRGAQDAPKYPHLRGSHPPPHHLDRHLHRQRSQARHPAVGSYAIGLSGTFGGSGSRPRVGRLRLLHSHARRPRGLEHAAREWRVGSNLSQREVPVSQNGMGVLESHRRREPDPGPQGQLAAGHGCRIGPDRRSGFRDRRHPTPGADARTHPRALQRAAWRPPASGRDHRGHDPPSLTDRRAAVGLARVLRSGSRGADPARLHRTLRRYLNPDLGYPFRPPPPRCGLWVPPMGTG